MKLDRNTNQDGTGKYALVKIREVNKLKDSGLEATVNTCLIALTAAGVVDYGNTVETDFFVIRLKDKYAAPALIAYAKAAAEDDEEYSKEIHHLADLATLSPCTRRPD